MTGFIFTSVFNNGSCASISLPEILPDDGYGDPVAKHCFDPETATVLLNRGNIFDGIRDIDKEWRSTILLFLAESGLRGSCSNGNVVAFTNGVDGVSASSSCPHFGLVTNWMTMETLDRSICPMMTTDQSFHKKIPSGVRIDITTVPNGLHSIEETFIHSFTSGDRGAHHQTLLRNAVMISTNSSGWVSDFLEFDRYFTTCVDDICDYALRCHTQASVGPPSTGTIDSDPFGVEGFKSTLNASAQKSEIRMRIRDYSDKCANLVFGYSLQNGSKHTLENPHGTVNLTNWTQIVVEFSRNPYVGCFNTSYVRIDYEVTDSFVNPSTHFWTTSTKSLTTTNQVLTSTAISSISTTSGATSLTQECSTSTLTQASNFTSDLSSTSSVKSSRFATSGTNSSTPELSTSIHVSTTPVSSSSSQSFTSSSVNPTSTITHQSPTNGNENLILTVALVLLATLFRF
ncbi:hypothetical protein L596_029663 [Steinernema carpocapsae]|uniref:Uncharacterized protein n=1 Tax=Steinernema carpocapsae TaxID=34508 RepID=A0A4U5LV99_STECR|nr:hypothetical protein L596_029663 [Steinernema carpocapsae]